MFYISNAQDEALTHDQLEANPKSLKVLIQQFPWLVLDNKYGSTRDFYIIGANCFFPSRELIFGPLDAMA